MTRRGGVAALRSVGLRVGLVPYQPERRSTVEWSSSYADGVLDYYEALTELGRYSAISGYVSWVSEARGAAVDLLDIGCGTGALCPRLGDQHVRSYLGVDLSPEAVAQARARQLPDARFLAGDATELDLDDADVIVLNEMLYYVADPTVFLDSLERALRPDGIVITSMWRHAGDRALWRILDQRWTLVDRIEVRNRANPVNRGGWTVGVHRRGGAPASAERDGPQALGAEVGDDAVEGLDRRRTIERGRGQRSFDGVVEEHDVAAGDVGHTGQDVAHRRTGLPIGRIDVPTPRPKASGPGGDDASGVPVALGRTEQRDRGAGGRFDQRPTAPVVDRQRTETAGPGIGMRRRVRADRVTLGDDATHQRGMLRGARADQEEGGLGTETRQLVEDQRRVARVRAVVEGQGHPTEIIESVVDRDDP